MDFKLSPREEALKGVEIAASPDTSVTRNDRLDNGQKE